MPRRRWRDIVLIPGFRRYAFNSGWVVLEQVLRALLNLSLGVYVARYLGPVQFGTFNFIISIVTVAAAFSKLGLDGILVRDLLMRPDQAREDLGSSFWLMVSGSVFSCLVVAAMMMGSLDTSEPTYTYVLLSLGVIITQPFAIVDIYCQSQVQVRYSSFCRMLTLVVGSLLRILAVYDRASLTAFFAILLIEQTVLVVAYLVTARVIRMPNFLAHFSTRNARLLLSSSWPVLINAIAGAVFIRIGQIIVTLLMDDHSAGIFAAASRIYEAWIYVPYVCIVSLAPALLSAKSRSLQQYHQRIAIITAGLFWGSMSLAVIFLVLGDEIIRLTFGAQYIASRIPICILMVASAFNALGNVANQYFIIEKKEGALAVKTLLGALANILLCFLLIPFYGEIGAALSILLSSALSNYVFLIWQSRRMPILRVVNQAILLRLAIR